jgi:hypothetical protein
MTQPNDPRKRTKPKGSIILLKPQRSNNYKCWKELLKIQKKKKNKKAK